jgi:transposase
MEIDLANLPDDTDALKALVLTLAGENAGLRADVKANALKIAQLEARIAKLKRMQFGQSSEKLAREIEQLELELDELHEVEGVRAAQRPASVQAFVEKPYRKPLPEHLPRQEEVHEPSCACLNCGGAMRRLGEDVTEVLEYVPASFKVIRHVRPKLSCRLCETIVQVPMPSLPIVGKLLGHTQAKTTQRYAHLFDDPVRQGVDAVGDMSRPKLRLVSSDTAPDYAA